MPTYWDFDNDVVGGGGGPLGGRLQNPKAYN